MSAPTAASTLKECYKRIDAILTKSGPLTPQESDELATLGRLAQQLDDLRYRRTHTTGAYSRAEEKRMKKAKKK